VLAAERPKGEFCNNESKSPAWAGVPANPAHSSKPNGNVLLHNPTMDVGNH
jgi:hypothetical protein